MLISYRKNPEWNTCNLILSGDEKQNIKYHIYKKLEILYINYDIDIIDVSINGIVGGDVELTIFFQLIAQSN